jgi:hypothetical protein
MANHTMIGNHLSLGPSRVCRDACVSLRRFPTDAEWHHVALTYAFPGPAYVLVDGTPWHSTFFPVDPRPTMAGGVLSIGQDSASFNPFSGRGFSGSQPDHGQIDAFRVWSSARSAEDVRNTMFSSPSSLGWPLLIASFDFETDAVTTSDVALSASVYSRRIVSAADISGIVAFGGCWNCTGHGLNPTHCASDAPHIVDGSPHVAKLSNPSSFAAVPLPFSLNSASCSLEQLSVVVSVVSVPSSGSLRDLLTGSARTSYPFDVSLFNGSRVWKTSSGCHIAGAGLVLFGGTSPSELPVTLNYSVMVTNTSSGEVAASESGSVLIVYDVVCCAVFRIVVTECCVSYCVLQVATYPCRW